MPKLTIHRKKEFTNAFRSITILLNNEVIGTIDNAHSTTFVIPEGDHVLSAKLDWCGSQKIDFTMGSSDMAFELSAFKLSWVVFVGVFASLIYFITASDVPLWAFGLVLALIGIPFLVVLYYLSFGRKRYLRLERSDS